MLCELCGGPLYFSGMDVPEDVWMEVWICEDCGHGNNHEVGTVIWWLEVFEEISTQGPDRTGGGK